MIKCMAHQFFRHFRAYYVAVIKTQIATAPNFMECLGIRQVSYDQFNCRQDQDGIDPAKYLRIAGKFVFGEAVQHRLLNFPCFIFTEPRLLGLDPTTQPCHFECHRVIVGGLPCLERVRWP